MLVVVFSCFACCVSDTPTVEIKPWNKHLVTQAFKGADIFTGDIDGDGKEEFVVIRVFDQLKFSWFDHEIIGEEHQWTEHIIDEGLLPADHELRDIDGDGDL